MAGRPQLTEGMRIATLQEEGKTERLAMQLDHDLFKEFMGLDIQTKLLIIALGSTAIDALLDAYQAWKMKKIETGQTGTPGIPQIPGAPGLSTGAFNMVEYLAGLAEDTARSGARSGLFGIGGIAIEKLFDKSKLQGEIPSGPYGAVNALATAATTTGGLAWAALFASIILGSGGLGGVLGKVGGGSGGLGAIAGAVV